MSHSIFIAAITSGVVVLGLVVFEFYSARRRERRIVSETASAVKAARDRSDENILETRRRTDVYQERTFALLEEQNVLLREILSELKKPYGTS